jgi:tRNA threonylcarbamoyladenosine biosynthesis protein TsaE
VVVVGFGRSPGAGECGCVPWRASPEPGAPGAPWPVVVRLTLRLADAAATAALAARIAAIARAGDVIALAGDLGSGKTTFARAFVRARGRADEEVPSPTFTLVQTYEGEHDGGAGAAPVWHFDLYRLGAPEDAIELDIDEAFSEAISLIEWPDRLGHLLPARRLLLTMAFDALAADSVRLVTLEGDAHWQRRLQEAGLA